MPTSQQPHQTSSTVVLCHQVSLSRECPMIVVSFDIEFHRRHPRPHGHPAAKPPDFRIVRFRMCLDMQSPPQPGFFGQRRTTGTPTKRPAKSPRNLSRRVLAASIPSSGLCRPAAGRELFLLFLRCFIRSRFTCFGVALHHQHEFAARFR